jgi:hypothetical protein
VYAASTAPDTVELRAAAVALLLGREDIAVDRTAAWVHGCSLPTLAGLPPVEAVADGRTSRTSLGGRRHLAARDLVAIGRLRLTTPLRTALDLGRLLAPDLAIGAIDALLRSGTFSHRELLAELSRFTGLRGSVQLRALAAQVDARSAGMAESRLRLHWHGAQLPTPVPGLPVAAGPRLVRLSLGVERRQFGAVLAHQVSAVDLVALEGAGWRVVVLAEERVLHSDPTLWVRHLEREFHQHLLAQAEAEAELG